jgi:MFS family permease
LPQAMIMNRLMITVTEDGLFFEEPGDLTIIRSQAIVRNYLVLTGLFTLAASLMWAVNALFMLDAGLDIFEVFVVNAAFTVGLVLFEIPTGVVADSTGRRRSFLLSVLILIIGTVGYLSIAGLGGGLAGFVVVSLILGIGYSFYSGAAEAWLVDALHAVGHDGQLDRIFARSEIVTSGAIVLGSVGGGLLGTLDLSWPLVLRAVLLAGVFGVGLSVMHDVGFVPRAHRMSAMPTEMRKVLQASIDFARNSRSAQLLMSVSLIQGMFAIWGFYAAQPYLLQLLRRDAVWVAGIITALMALATNAGNLAVEFFARFCGRRTTLLIAAATALAIAAAGAGLADSFWTVLLMLLLLNAAQGVGGPVQRAYLHTIAPSAQRATVASAVSLVGGAGGIVGQLGLGWIARTQSLAGGYLTAGLTLLIAIPPLLLLRRIQEPADTIIGRQTAGRNGACAGQDLDPQLLSLKARPETIPSMENAGRPAPTWSYD